jgi:membrane protease YdiL (CAAX protease family)
MPPAMDPETLPAWNALMSSWDVWLLMFALAVVVPVRGHVRLKRLQIQKRSALSVRAKIVLYVQIVCWQWFLVIALLLVLRRHGLSLGEIGEHLADARLTLGVSGALLFVLAVVCAIGRWRLRRARAKVGGPSVADYTRALVPSFGQEMWVFALVCVTSGICEELLYRGWLINLLRVMTGSVWIAIAVGVAVFGVAHAYQGAKGMLRASFIGLQLAALFVYVDSLIPGQVLHAGANLVTGLLLAMVASRSTPPVAEPSVPPETGWSSRIKR